MPQRLFTAQNAVEMGKRGAIARKASAERSAIANERAKALLAMIPPDRPLSAKQQRLEEQLARLDVMIDKATEGRRLLALISAKEKLVNLWAELVGHPKRPTRRQGRQQARPAALPTEPAEQVAPQPAAYEPKSSESEPGTAL